MAERENFDLAHISAVEILTPKFDESLWFFKDLLAMREVDRIGNSVYLRCWDEYETYSIKLTDAATNGVGRTMLRTTSQDALERRVAAVEQTGLGRGWKDPEVGIGKYYEFEDPDGHVFGLYYDTTQYQPDEQDRPALKNQASRYPGYGVNARRLITSTTWLPM